ncbi:MAG: imidazolonepropionase-like amidohydrolase [Planctomycetota bacterium]
MRYPFKATACIAPLFALLVAAPASAGWAFADDKDKEDEASEDAGADEESDEEEERWFAAIGGDVHDGLGGVLRGATLLSKNGKIEEIGYDLYLPEDTETLDATGFQIWPGLVSVASTDLFGGTSALEDTVDPFNRSMVLALGSGITSAVQSNQAAKLKRGEIEGVVMTPKVFASLSYKNSDPRSKTGLEEKLEKAAAYRRAVMQWEVDVKKDKTLKAPSKKDVDADLLEVLAGTSWAMFSADERTDLLGIARLAQKYGFRPVIEGCTEGWTVADELGRAGAFVVMTPRGRKTKSERVVRDGGSSIENAAILHRAGVQVAIVPGTKSISLGGIVGRDMMHLPIEAGFAIRGGLPEQAALDAITLVPARLMRVDHRVGSLEVGKDCDLIITDGDVLHYQTFVQWAVVEGKVAYNKEEELFFAHIRPRPEATLAPETKLDAGETLESEEEEATSEGEVVEEVEEEEEEKAEADDDERR